MCNEWPACADGGRGEGAGGQAAPTHDAQPRQGDRRMTKSSYLCTPLVPLAATHVHRAAELPGDVVAQGCGLCGLRRAAAGGRAEGIHPVRRGRTSELIVDSAEERHGCAAGFERLARHENEAPETNRGSVGPPRSVPGRAASNHGSWLSRLEKIPHICNRHNLPAGNVCPAAISTCLLP